MAIRMRKLGRKRAHRDHTLRNLAASVILYEKADTTIAKAKTVRSLVDRWITTAKKNSLASRRNLLAGAFDAKVVEKLFDILVKRYVNRHSGYTRIVRLGARMGDGSEMVRIEMMDRDIFLPDTKEASNQKDDKQEQVQSEKPARTRTRKLRKPAKIQDEGANE